MRFMVFALALIFVGCSTHYQYKPGDLRVSSVFSEPDMTVIWLDNPGGFPSVGFYDVQVFFNESDLKPGSYVRVASLHATGTSQHDLLGKLRLKAGQVGADRLLIVQAEEKKEEFHLYSGLENVARFFSGERTVSDRKDVGYTLRIDAIAIRQVDGRSTLAPTVHRDDRSNVYQPRRADSWPAFKQPRRADRRPLFRPPRRKDNRPAVRPPRRKEERPSPPRDDRPPVKPPRRDDRPPVKPPIPKDEPPIEVQPPPPPRDDRPTVKPPPPPPEDDRPAAKPPPPPREEDRSPLKRPRMKTHRP